MYFCATNFAVAVNYKVASTSLAYSIIDTYYSDIINLEKAPNTPGIFHQLCPKADLLKDKNKDILLLVRDPVERFKSAILESGKSDIDDVLFNLDGIMISGRSFRDCHFEPQIRLCDVDNNIKLYRYAIDINDMVNDLGLCDFPHLNKSCDTVTLSSSQIDKVREIYKEDIKLYNMIQEPGQLLNHDDIKKISPLGGKNIKPKTVGLVGKKISWFCPRSIYEGRAEDNTGSGIILQVKHGFFNDRAYIQTENNKLISVDLCNITNIEDVD